MPPTNSAEHSQIRRVSGRFSRSRSWPRASGSPQTAAFVETDERATTRWLENRDRGQVVAVWRRFEQILWKGLNRLTAPVVYPWSPLRNAEGLVYDLHRTVAELQDRSLDGGVERVWLWMKALLWPAVALIAAVPLVVKCGGGVRTRHGLGYRAQLRDVLEAAWKYGIFPTEYYHHGIFEEELRGDKSVYLNDRKIRTLISACDREPGSNVINDLRSFHSACQSAGFAVPRIIAEFREGEIEAGSRNGSSFLPEKDLFIRPDRWFEGEAGELWRWNARARIWSYRREALGSLALVERCRKLSSHRNILIQEALNNHPDMARFSSGGFCTVRISTGMDREGLPVPMFASLCLPAANQGGWAAPTGMLTATIEIQDGSLNPARGEFLSDGVFHSHPETGAIIAGATVPQWGAVVDLAMRAHRHFSKTPFIGWEIGFSGAGPVILEASTKWGINRCGMPARTPFAQLCHERLDSMNSEVGPHEPVSSLG